VKLLNGGASTHWWAHASLRRLAVALLAGYWHVISLVTVQREKGEE
jgi:hypothetical protein